MLFISMYGYILFIFFFFFKQNTAYEMRISDWSSDVCSSDLQDIDLGWFGWPYLDYFKLNAFGDAAVSAYLRVFDPDTGDSFIVDIVEEQKQIGRASCRERVCQYV